MGLFGKRDKTVQGQDTAPQVPITKNVMRVTYSDNRGSLMQHDVVIDQRNSDDFNVRHVMATNGTNPSQIHRIDKVGEERG